MAKKHNSMIRLALACCVAGAGFIGDGPRVHAADPFYEPTWRSLKQHATPQWLSDAKFGIYTHWQPGRRQDVAKFKAEKFNAEEWADLFKRAGAEFAGPVAEHVAQFAMWDSQYTKRDAVDTGPKRDIVGELKAAIERRGMKFFVSFHGPVESEQGLKTKVTEVVDKYQPDIVWFDVGFGGTLDARNWARYVGGKKIAGKDNLLLAHQRGLPSGGIKESVRKEFLAHYFNQARAWGKEVEFLYKEFDVPPGVGMRDIEDGRLADLSYDEWINDMDIADPTGWFYHDGITFHTPRRLVHELVDMVSKNGRLLLNVPPKPDGTFPEPAVERLLEIGKWLEVNGEAIYGTTAWNTYGEGPTELSRRDVGDYQKEQDFDFDRLESLIEAGEIQAGHYTQAYKVDYQPQDVRFTVKGNVLYAICLGWPGKEITIETLGTRGALTPGEIKSVTMLGVEGPLKWKHKAEGLTIELPNTKPCKYAFTFKITRQ